MPQHGAHDRHNQASPDTARRGEAGWMNFAAVMMSLLGLWWIISGLVAIADDGFLVASQDYLFKFSATAWGWIHLVLGAVIGLAGLALFRRAPWARFVAMVVASIGLVVAFAWLPWYPAWGIIFMVASGFVVWALTVHADYLVEE